MLIERDAMLLYSGPLTCKRKVNKAPLVRRNNLEEYYNKPLKICSPQINFKASLMEGWLRGNSSLLSGSPTTR